MIKIIHGNHILIHQLNDFFSHVSAMILEHFDNAAYDSCLFVLGSYVYVPIEQIRQQFPNKKIIVYQLEQAMSLKTWQSLSFILDNIRYADEIWDYDYLNVKYLEEQGIIVDKLVPMLYTKSLDRLNLKENPEIDVLFYGMINERRFKIFELLQRQLYGQIRLVWIYGDSDVDKYIENSKLVLNIHATEPWNRQEQVRMFFPLINGKTNISEPSQRNNMIGEIIESPIEELSDNFIRLCSSNEWRDFGIIAKEKFKERSKLFLEQEFKL